MCCPARVKGGFCYETIVHFLAEYHGISMNVRTLKRKLRHYGLRRRNHLHSEHTVREIIKREIEGPLSLLGYRGMWNKLRTTYHVTVPWDMVIKIYDSWIQMHQPFEGLESCNVDHKSHQGQRKVAFRLHVTKLVFSISKTFFSISKIFFWISRRFLDCKLF